MLSEESKRYIIERLSPLMPIFAKASIGDYSQDVDIPEEDEGFAELYTGIQVMLDVIRQKIASLEKEIKERKKMDERLQGFLDTMMEGLQIIDFNWKYLYVNDAVIKQGKKTKQDLVGHTMMELYPDIEKTELFTQLKRCMDERVAHKMENEFVFLDGNKGWFELHVEPIPEGIFILSLDITERKRHQEEVGRIASIVESSNDAIIGKDVEGIVTSWNPAAEKLYGYKSEEIVGKSITYIFPQDRKDEFENIMQRIRKGERVDYFETKRRTKDGKKLDVSVTISPIKNAEGIVVGASDIGRDITERKKQEEEISRLAAIVESSNDAIIGKTLDGIITTWNKGAGQLYGYTATEIVGKPNKVLIPEDHSNEWDEFTDKLSHGETITDFETVRVHKDGRRIDVSITFSPIKDATDTITGISAIVRDITERKRIDSMKSEFVALASHQLKTPLTSIRWYSELLLKITKANLTEKQIQYLQEIYKANKRMIMLVEALLDVSQIDLGTFVISPVKSNLIDIIENVIQEYSVQVADKRIHIEKNFDNSLPAILLDVNVMRIIVSNLISNAIQYSPANGAIVVAVSKNDGQVHISVTDNGIGIPASQGDKIFKKFSRADNAALHNTTGSGLGLYIVKSLVDRSGGSVMFASEENKGTMFTISFPLSGMKGKDQTGQQQ